MTDKELTITEAKFVNLILEGINGTQAMLQVKPELKNENSAGVMANKWLRRVKIKNAIDKRKSEINKKTLIDSVSLSNKTEKLIEKAIEKGQINAALRGVEILAKLNGAFTENKPNPAAEQERAKKSEKEIRANQELVQTWLNSKYNTVKHVDSVEVQAGDSLSITGHVEDMADSDTSQVDGGDNDGNC